MISVEVLYTSGNRTLQKDYYDSFEQLYDDIENQIKRTIRLIRYNDYSRLVICINEYRTFDIGLKNKNDKIIIAEYEYALKNDQEEVLDPMYLCNYFKLFLDSPNLTELLN
jgi:hypothetical protein